MAERTAPLLETKYHAPKRRSNVVGRPRLDERMAGPDAPALTLVSAPAGFGKTTVITEWLDQARATGRIIAWLSLDRRDNDPTVFWSYVIASLTATGAIGADATTLLDTPQTPIDAVITTVANELGRLEREVVLVLDDYHVIESTQVQDSMLFLLEHLPHRVHLVVATRSDPPWPLGQWRARGELLEIRAADLRFTSGEASDYLADAMGLTVSSDDVAALEGRTEGWIAALQLAALSLQGREDVAGFIEDFTGDDRYIVDYLVEEVLHRQTPEDREFLMQTSVLDRLTGSLCDVVTDATGSKARLDALDRANLFLVALDDRRHWYRYHHLFADMLRARLLDERPEIVPRLHRRASVWFDEHDDRAEAIRHAIAGGDTERAAELIELAMPVLRQTRQEATVFAWLDTLPDAVVASRPVLGVALAGAWMATGELGRAATLLDEIEAAIAADTGPGGPTHLVAEDEAERRRLPTQMALYRAAMALVAGDLDTTTTQAQRALELGGADDHLGRGAATALIGLALWTAGDLESAQHRYSHAIASLEAAGHLSDALGCRIALADIQTARGRLGEALRTVEVGLASTEGRGAVRGTADMHVAIADLLRERNDLDGALHHLEASRALGDAMGLPQNPHRWDLVMARVSQARGDLGAALDLAATAARLYNGDYSPDTRPVAAVQARVHIAAGDTAAALRWAADHGIATDDEPTYLHEFEHLTLARALIGASATTSSSAGDDEVSRFLDRLLTDAERGQRAGSAIEILALQALHALAAGHLDTALLRLEAALERAEPEGFTRVFLDEGAPMTGLLRTATARGARSERARALLAAGDHAEQPTRPRPQPGLVDPLSTRELEVLRLLRTDLTGPEIASELIVSLNTMRTHTKSIYQKLGVNSRRAAVRRAGELGL
jgi:LuxR family maltose regulon positive regulatory protein